jgi:hypothetical protein
VPAHKPDRPLEMRGIPARDASAKPPATEQANEPSRHPAELRRIMRRARSLLGQLMGQLLSSSYIRFPMIFLIGVVATLAWQSYSDAGKEIIAGWCRLQAPQAASVAQNIAAGPEDLVAVSPDLLKATSLDLLKATSVALAAVRESIDKLAADLAKLQTVDRGSPDNRASVASPPASGTPPASRPPAPRVPPPH